MKNSYTYSLAPLNHNFYNFSSNISKYNENKRILNRKNNNINRINNNNVFNLNSYQINSSPKIFKYTFKNNIENSPYNSTKAKIINQKRARNSKYISDNSSFMSHKKIKDINSRKDFMNNSLSKGNLSMNKSSKYFYPNFKERYASKKIVGYIMKVILMILLIIHIIIKIEIILTKILLLIKEIIIFQEVLINLILLKEIIVIIL